jgi:hypothetical protein
MTHPQLLEGLKEESQVDNSGKREGVEARSLTRNTKGVEGRAGAPGLGLGIVTSLIHLLELASKPTTKWLVRILEHLGAKTSHGQLWTHKTHHGPDLGEATTFPHIVLSMPLHGTCIQMAFCPKTPKEESRNCPSLDSRHFAVS